MSKFFKFAIFLIFTLLILGCEQNQTNTKKLATSSNEMKSSGNDIIFDTENLAYHFDFPVGKPDAKGYYNAQSFTKNNHLGEDWNATTGGNTDLGDPTYAIANGYVKSASNLHGGWGKVIRILHKMPNGEMVESVYAHCQDILVSEKNWVKRGDKIATIGNAGGIYLAHLHFEIRSDVDMSIGGGYSRNTQGYLNPTKFIRRRR